jgi:hypothetical protein
LLGLLKNLSTDDDDLREDDLREDDLREGDLREGDGSL